MGKRAWSLVLLMTVVGLPVPGLAAADEPSAAPAQQGPDRVDEMLGRYNLHPAFAKGGRGLSNFFLGWLEVPYNIHQHYAPSDAAASWFTGLGYGVVKGLVRTAVGFYEGVTFFLPYPENFAPILPTLPYFQRDQKRQPLPLE
jgi:putative exosortase-associated protein (TIGR04073 family)